ncbi:SCO-spondin-like [Mercenaria mercenaria]|uniref:SCO-spondin-like n=1 Tax=Mercenaria mercenaria TaxID=6596 RepID=UPI00234F950F|nr:SCO-spondin-like [Mercenaria mercenaria]
MWQVKTKIVFVILIHICRHISLFRCQEIDKPRGPWQLAFKVVSGNWNSTATGYSSFWELFTSTDTYNTASPVPDQRNFNTSSDSYKSKLVQQWEDGFISVQTIKLSFFKNNEEKAYVVFDAIGKTKTTWFKCDNILYSSYTDLPDNTLPTECPGKNAMGLPLTMMKVSYLFAYCPQTTGWLVVADTDFSFSLCPNYMPADGSEPYFKYSSLTTVADLSTQLETADSIGIFFQVWDMAFKGVEGIKPSAVGLNNLTGLFMQDITENDNSDLTVRNLQHSQSSQIFKSDVINLWDTYFIDMVKFSMSKSGVEKAYVVFDGVNTDKLSWFSESNILYSSYGSSLDGASLEMCSIEGDDNRNWQIQSLADDTGCSSSEQLGWMLVKEPKNNGTCSWDTSTIKKKPFFLYNADTSAANPSTFQYADVIAVFVHGWRLVLKLAAGGSVSPKSSVHSLWSETGSVNEGVDGAASLASGTTYKSSIIDQWTSFYIRAVKIAAYKDGLEVFNAVFDATGSSNIDWLDCARLLYTSVSGLTGTTANTNSYACSLHGESSTFRFLLGKSPDCGSVSATGVFSIVDADSACSSRNDLPQFLFSNTLDTSLTDMTESQLADTFAVFIDMANCYTDTCLNGATCQDLGGNFRCFCDGSYYGATCANLDGTFGDWSTWSECSVTCANGTQSRNRTCIGAEGDGICSGESTETTPCSLDPCPSRNITINLYSTLKAAVAFSVTLSRIHRYLSLSCSYHCKHRKTVLYHRRFGNMVTCQKHFSLVLQKHIITVDGVYTEWITWTQCTVTCGTGTRNRSRECTNPSPQHGGSDCVEPATESENCSTNPCPIDGGLTVWADWTSCSVSCEAGTQSRERLCTNPTPQYGGANCTGETLETNSCDLGPCPINGGYTAWNAWTACNVTCGGGEQSRSRECSNPLPQYGGNNCSGDTSESQACNSDNCPINGGYTAWSAWTACNVTCGGGEQSRSRECSNPLPQYGGNNCSGDASESQACNSENCPINGGYTTWSAWTACNVTCGGGEQSRSRECSNPLPQYGGNNCSGDASETQNCNSENCPINGGYTAWSAWTACNVTCGGGEQSRSRECSNPLPQYGGNNCSGDASETQNCNSENCPINGGYTAWSAWTACNVTCGGGEQSRSRECSNPLPQYGGNNCSGDASESQACNSGNCPINGGYTAWSAWTACNVTCGGGEQSRSRECSNPLPQYGGNNCSGDTSETQACNSENCPINGGYTAWSAWTACNVTCGGGEQTRSRECSNPLPQYGGNNCSGDASETQACNSENCPINGGYTAWSAWTACNVTCGGGEQSRSRECSNPLPQYGGNNCSGDTSESQACNSDNCPINGGYTAWSAWTACNVTCGGGEQSRSRECSNPLPQYGGNNCSGDASESQACNSENCPINGGYTAWSAWTACNVTCGGGEQSRSRECSNPLPQYGGNNCSGDASETQACNSENCPVNGGYTAWSAWTACNVTCGGGEQSRSRECSNPPPQYGGNNCSGDASETQNCNSENCPINGGYTAWSAWTACNVTCGGGEQSRSRECSNPLPQYGGNNCSGDASETQNCNSDNCPINGGYTAWSAWTACNVTCGGGEQSRSRECSNPLPQYGGNNCSGDASETQACNSENCPINGGYTTWSAWTACYVTCGGGEQSRSRECSNPPPEYGGNNCSGDASETQACNSNNCPINGGYTIWSAWTACNVTCGGGEQSRTRECSNPPPQYGGNTCSGDAFEAQACNSDTCPINGGYTTWSAWTACYVTCGGGEQSRTRECSNPPPQYGGNNCSGDAFETQACNSDNCPINGGYTAWSAWTACTVTCGGGEQSRSRECSNPPPQYGGNNCSGDASETQACNSENCPISGGYTAWSAWTACNVTCGGGEQSRSRECSNPLPQYGGNNCSGDTSETQACNSENCPINGGYTTWSAWTACNVTCGGGEQSRSRECSNPLPQYGGNNCFGDASETQACNSENCPINGGYTAWSAWTACNVTCGGGEQSRSRECSSPLPQYGGNNCSGDASETQNCNSENCPINGGYTAWSAWTACNVTCGGGEQSRSRECSNPPPQYGGYNCSGNTSETQACNSDNCPINGGYTAWSAWTACNVTCGGGEQSRSRECSNPLPKYGGNNCSGDASETQACISDNCPINGGYTAWSAWTACNVTCGGGEQSRSRECSNPLPQYGGSNCSGDASETEACNSDNCPINGGYTTWSAWTACNVTCGGGEQSRSRECTNILPQYGGNNCSGDATETQACNSENCPINGGYTAWSAWTACNVTCGGGEQSRSRECSNPLPQYGGSNCSGDASETQACNSDNCPINGGYTTWSAWTACNVTCGGGEQSRSRDCSNPPPQYGGNNCSGDASETQACNSDNCPINGGYTAWSAWTACNVTCGGGEQSRSRECINPPPQYGGQSCSGDHTETLVCGEQNCPVNGGFTEWTPWGTCTTTCGYGQQNRSRDCNNPSPQYGGSDCIGDYIEIQECNVDLCPADGGYTVWTEWSTCSVTCGAGERTRSRECTNPSPEHGGAPCDGAAVETILCTEGCPDRRRAAPSVDGGFTEWTVWTDCSVTCGDGEQTRSRTCTNPEPQNGGTDCVGDTQESQTCNLASCPQEKVDGGFTEWTPWTECPVSCGGSEQTRTRTCSNPEPQNGGSDCVGDTEESQQCNTGSCPPVDGGFTEWSSWTECSVTCGDGEQTRTRACTNPEPQNGGNDCIGDTQESQSCNLTNCPVNGSFTEWSSWNDCSVTCGNGIHTRTRNCSDPEPLYGGDDCVGEVEETESCSFGPCPVDGYWSNWEEWTTCSASCDSGTRERTRTCVEPLNGGNPCDGASKQVEFCNIKACPLDGVWSEWTAWEDCNATCEGGIRTRTRTCIGPLHGGEECNGTSEENEICNSDPCPIDGYWSNWNEWTTCTATCNTGTRERTRTCVEPQDGGKECTGAAVQTEFCNTELCPVDGKWLDWSEWDNCTAPCGGGSRNRSRTCVEPMHGGKDCIGEDTETDACNEDPCPVNGFWLNWLAWGSCSVSCSDGTRNRSRVCMGPLHGGLDCIGESSESESCDNWNCPVDGYWSDWSEWTKCSATCGGGYRNKSRTCNEPLYGGLMCQGEMSETDTCNVDACPIDGEWSDWTQWSTCTATCGGGTREKTRACSEPKYGGKFCEGEASETNMCNVEPCPVDGYWEEWSEWTECSVPCAGGSRDRTRACVQPKFGGKECVGTDAETEECNTQKCPVDGFWTTWSQWSECSSTCNGGARNRSRSCIEPEFGGKTCSGRDIDIQICGMEACPSVDGGWSAWTGWTACSMTCGFAERTRNRTCTNPSPMWGGRYCEGVHIQSDSCKENDCPVDGEWTEWTSWTPCFNMTANGFLSPKCGRGFKERNRSCDNPAPQFEGSDCAGNSMEVITCNVPCHTITCSKEHPENCQIIFQNIPQNKGFAVSASTSVAIFILLNTIRLYL